MSLENLKKRVENLARKLARYYENSYDSWYYERAEQIIELLENKFKTDEKAIEKLLDMDITFEIIPYLSNVDLLKFEQYKKDEYNKASKDLKDLLSPLEAYFWKWKYGFDIEKAYRWHKVKVNHTIRLSFEDIPDIDKYLTPEETDFLLKKLKKFSIHSRDLVTVLNMFGKEVVKIYLKAAIEELKQIRDKKLQKWLTDLQLFERFYNLHMKIYEKYRALRKELEFSYIGTLLNNDIIVLYKDYDNITGTKKMNIMWLDGTIEEALSLKDVICVGWYKQPPRVVDFPGLYAMYFVEQRKWKYYALDVYKINLSKAVELLKVHNLIDETVDIEKEIKKYKILYKKLKALETKHSKLTNIYIWLPIDTNKKELLYIPSLLNEKGDRNIDEVVSIETKFEKVKNYIENLLDYMSYIDHIESTLKKDADISIDVKLFEP